MPVLNLSKQVAIPLDGADDVGYDLWSFDLPDGAGFSFDMAFNPRAHGEDAQGAYRSFLEKTEGQSSFLPALCRLSDADGFWPGCVNLLESTLTVHRINLKSMSAAWQEAFRLAEEREMGQRSGQVIGAPHIISPPELVNRYMQAARRRA